ncbi:MAG: DUF169 domain-containing protein [Gemmataceae bacterium]|nr:DUF169 domain-containing protein [Gemmataceae bacterium]MCI0740816.1 DUF169 domain-containing protein [Gemmataceae bacterium]
MTTAKKLQELLDLDSAPVALKFQATPPAGVRRVDAAAPSGCTYWKLAAEGRTFYTEAQDHYNCPIGSYTHGIDLPPERAKELPDVLGVMFGLGYLRQEEVPGIPRREGAFGVAVYAPLADATFDPDVVLVRGNAKQMMLLSEAAQAAGVSGDDGLMGRPTCAAVPQALRTQSAVASLGCIGNRIYTGLADDELYFAIPGKHLGAIVEKLASIVSANQTLESYHRGRLQTIGST